MVLVTSYTTYYTISLIRTVSSVVHESNEGGDGSTWGGVHLVMGDIIFWTPIESRTVQVFQDIYIFVKYFKG